MRVDLNIQQWRQTVTDATLAIRRLAQTATLIQRQTLGDGVGVVGGGNQSSRRRTNGGDGSVVITKGSRGGHRGGGGGGGGGGITNGSSGAGDGGTGAVSPATIRSLSANATAMQRRVEHARVAFDEIEGISKQAHWYVLRFCSASLPVFRSLLFAVV
jgi:hypothetical protein